ncbi:MAG: hypothetical protein WCW31_06205 [Patescibacteria group bacterium]
MEQSNKTLIVGIAIALAIIVLGGVLYLSWSSEKSDLRQQLSSLQGDVQNLKKNLDQKSATSTAEPQTPQTSDLAIKTVDWNKKTYSFLHRCVGEAKTAKFPGAVEANFCIGTNRLEIFNGQNSKVLDESAVTEPAKAPLLLGVQYIAQTSSTSATVLISYSPEPCATTNDCGAGMPTNYVTMSYSLKDGVAKKLDNYPDNGLLMWNSDYTKAFSLPVTCGGAGCAVGALRGYDLTADIAKEITTDKAAEIKDAQSATGDKLPYWKDVKWSDKTHVTAVIVTPGKPDKKVEVVY